MLAHVAAVTMFLRSVCKTLAKAPMKVSPAAVVSTALTLKAGTMVASPSSEMKEPFDPKVMITPRMPNS